MRMNASDDRDERFDPLGPGLSGPRGEEVAVRVRRGGPRTARFTAGYF